MSAPTGLEHGYCAVYLMFMVYVCYPYPHLIDVTLGINKKRKKLKKALLVVLNWSNLGFTKQINPAVERSVIKDMEL